MRGRADEKAMMKMYAHERGVIVPSACRGWLPHGQQSGLVGCQLLLADRGFARLARQKCGGAGQVRHAC